MTALDVIVSCQYSLELKIDLRVKGASHEEEIWVSVASLDQCLRLSN